jgi:hypothetical protein
MDIVKRFSIEDFLAYLFPGAIGTMGLYLLLLLTPLHDSLISLKVDIIIGILLFIWSYSLGLILTGLGQPIATFLNKQIHLDNPIESIPLGELNQEILKAYKVIFKIDGAPGNWSKDQFYLCRTLVAEFMPNAIQVIRRHNSLVRFRGSMSLVGLIWFFPAIVWGIQNIGSQWGIPLIILSIILEALLLFILAHSVNSSRKREVRETYTALLVGYHTGVFNKHFERGREP